MNRIRKGDQVVVTAGKDKGKKGDVIRVAGDKVVVSNVNIIKRHTKPNPQAGQPGGVIEREAPIHISNVMLFNPASARANALPSRSGGWTQIACVSAPAARLSDMSTVSKSSTRTKSSRPSPRSSVTRTRWKCRA
jgi:large subunit ribosomal protein L24